MSTHLGISAEFRSKQRTPDTPVTSIRSVCSQDCKQSGTACRTKSPLSCTTCARLAAPPDVDNASLNTVKYHVALCECI